MISDELRDYFKNMYKDVDSNIVLDDDQINAIINDNPAVLILAGAGTGKTTTMVAKVKYLVDIKHVDPSKILVISYTRKAVEELRDIINEAFDINCEVSTFHSFGYKYIRYLFSNRKCVVVDDNFKENVFYEYINKMFKENKIKLLIDNFNQRSLEHFSYFKYFIDHYEQYSDYDSFFEDYKKHKLEEARNNDIVYLIDLWTKRNYFTLKGEFVKSASEKVIANFLYKHGIDYSYEKVYEDVVEDRKIYRPDFTLDFAGQKVYLEYFGMSDVCYNKIKYKKLKYHSEKNNLFIYIDSMPIEDIEKVLDYKLKEFGFVYRDRSNEEIYLQILEFNKLAPVEQLMDFFYDIVFQIKESYKRENYRTIVEEYIKCLSPNEQELAIKQFRLFNDFYVFYNNKLYTSDVYYFDFSDLLYYANKYISDVRYLTDIIKYDYMIIDEYQDISDGEYLFARKTSDRCSSKVFVVGDDWQSIYAFRGSNIRYITRFEQYFSDPTIVSIRNTYRNSQELIDISGEFIMKNPFQIKKRLISSKHLSNPIKFIPFDGSDFENEYLELENQIKKIHSEHPDHSILVLGRNNKMINRMFYYNKDFSRDLDNKIKVADINDLQLEGMTIHKSKGLTYDEVIIIGMSKAFPSSGHIEFWIKDLFKPKPPIEGIDYPEERRLFYVALTRTKNNVFILYDTNPRYRSKFVDELMGICKEMSN